VDWSICLVIAVALRLVSAGRVREDIVALRLCYFLKFVTVLTLYKFVFTFLYKNKMHASETRRQRPPPVMIVQ